MRSDLVGRAGDFCRQWDMLPAEGTVLCAVSGGRDSMALLDILLRLLEGTGVRLAAAHFNHCLRTTADRDEQFVREWCGRHGVTFLAGRGDVRAYAAGTGVEDAARQMRYAFLEEAADRLGASRIATAHHQDDNAETVLLHLLRGTGLRGLCGIPPVRGRIIRPLLEISRAEIDGYVAERHIPYVEDETNGDAAYTRNRLRLEVLPLLEEISPGCTARIATASSLLREEEERLQAEAEEILPAGNGEEIVLPVPVLGRQDAAMRRRLVRAMGLRLGVTLTRRQVEAVLRLGSGGMVSLPGELCAVRLAHKLILRKMGPLPPPMLLRFGRQIWGDWQVTLRELPGPQDQGVDSLVLDASVGPLSIGAWDGSGRLAVENGSRTLKRLFMDCGIPVQRRREHPVIYAGGRPVAALGVGVDWDLRPQAGRACLVVSFDQAMRSSKGEREAQ